MTPPRATLQATLDGLVKRYGSHLVDVAWDGFQVRWTLYDLDLEELTAFRPEAGEELDLNLSPETVCVGDFRKKDYAPCPNAAKVSARTPQCRLCSKTLIERQECIFEPRCHGVDCKSRICSEEHAVYLAFYGQFPKVGLTLAPRLRTRLVEQGADAYSVLSLLPDRLAAREFEKEISKDLGIPERVHPSRVLSLMTRPLEREAVRDEYLRHRGRLLKERGLYASGLEWLDGYPMPVLRAKPRKREAAGRHWGTIVGMKGKYLVYENNGLNALNMNEMPGRYVSLG